MTWLNIYASTYRDKIDEMVLEEATPREIFNFLSSKGVADISLKDVEEYVDNWLLAVLRDTYIDYMWLHKRAKGKMAEYEESDIFENSFLRNKFILESMVARTLYRINNRYKDKGMDDKTFKDLNQLILTAIDKMSELNKKMGIVPDTKGSSQGFDIEEEDSAKSTKAITKSDLESYLLTKSEDDQRVIKQFISDLQTHFTIINLEEYVHKSKL